MRIKQGEGCTIEEVGRLSAEKAFLVAFVPSAGEQCV